MALQPAFRLLADFGSSAVAPKRVAPDPTAREVQREMELAESFQRGLAEGRAQGLATLEARLAEERAALVARLEGEQRTRLAEQGETLGRDLVQGLAALQDRIAEDAAAVLAPWLEARARESAVADLHIAIDKALAGADGITVRAAGPRELLEGLERTLAGRDLRLVLAPDERSELRVAIGATHIELALSAWLQRIGEDPA
jgi:hypothetical protein